MRRIKSFGLLISAVFFLAFFSSCDEDNNIFRVDYSLAEELLFDTAGALRTTTDSGLIIYELDAGSGPLEVVSRDNILLYYTIRFKPTDQIIESSYGNNSTFPLQFNGIANAAGRQGDGFVEGVLGMKEGAKRVVLIPPTLSVYSDTVIVDLELDSILF